MQNLDLQIIEAMPHTEYVQSFVEKLGDFYEAIDEMPPGFNRKPKYWINSASSPNGALLGQRAEEGEEEPGQSSEEVKQEETELLAFVNGKKYLPLASCASCLLALNLLCLNVAGVFPLVSFYCFNTEYHSYRVIVGFPFGV